MKTMARILIVIMVIAMMVNLVACDNSGSDNDDVANDGGTNNEEVVNTPLVDIEYTPNTEGLIGFAVYPVIDGQYPYDEGDIIDGHHNCFIAGWKMVYTKCLDLGYGSWQSSDFLKEKDLENNVCTTTYVTENLLVWGYVYQQGEDIFIIATRDIVNYNENNPVSRDVTVANEGFQPYTNYFVIKHTSDN